MLELLNCVLPGCFELRREEVLDYKGLIHSKDLVVDQRKMLVLDCADFLFFLFVLVKQLVFILLPYLLDGLKIRRVHPLQDFVKI